MNEYEAGHDSSLTVNATKTLGNPYDLRGFDQLTEEIFVTALVKYVEGNGNTKKVFNGHMKNVFPHRVLWPFRLRP